MTNLFLCFADVMADSDVTAVIDAIDATDRMYARLYSKLYACLDLLESLRMLSVPYDYERFFVEYYVDLRVELLSIIRLLEKLSPPE